MAVLLSKHSHTLPDSSPLTSPLNMHHAHTHVCGVLTCLHQHTLCTACVFRTLTDKGEQGRHTTPLYTYTIINADRIDFSSKYIHKQYNTFWTFKHPFVKQNLCLKPTDNYFSSAKHAVVGTSWTLYKQMLFEWVFNILFGNWVDKWNKMGDCFCRCLQIVVTKWTKNKTMFNCIFGVLYPNCEDKSN